MIKNKKNDALLDYINKYRFLIALFLIIIFAAALSLIFFYGPSWINGSDNYINVNEARLISEGHFSSLNTGLEDNVKYLLFFGIAVFYYLFGYTNLTSAFFGVFSLAITIIIIYKIGTLIYDKRVGIIAALLYAIFPLVIIESSNSGDNIPMVMFICIGLFFTVNSYIAKKSNVKYAFLSGIFSSLGLLIVPEALIGIFMIFIINIVYVFTLKKGRFINLGVFLLGILFFFLILFSFSFMFTGNPLYILKTYQQNLGNWNTTPNILSYLYDIFYNVPLIFSNKGLTILFYNSIFDTEVFGLFGIFIIFASIYLLIKKEKRSLIPVVWFVSTLLYLGFGSQSFTSYVPVLFDIRFALIFIPAVCLIISIFLIDITDYMLKKFNNIKLSYIFLVISLFILVTSSIVIIRYINYSQYYMTLPLIQIGSYINSLPVNTTVLGPVDIPWSTYITGNQRITTLGYVRYQNICANVTKIFNFKKGYYFIGNLTDYQACNMTIVFKPNIESRLDNYTMFKNWGFNFYNYNVYKYN